MRSEIVPGAAKTDAITRQHASRGFVVCSSIMAKGESKLAFFSCVSSTTKMRRYVVGLYGLKDFWQGRRGGT